MISLRLRIRLLVLAVAVVAGAGCGEEGVAAKLVSKPALCTGWSSAVGPFPGADDYKTGITVSTLGRPAGNRIVRGVPIDLEVWVDSDERITDLDVEILGTGTLDDIEWSTCRDFETTLFVTIQPTRLGKGEIRFVVDGDERERLSLIVADPVGMEVVFDASYYKDFEARLLDAEGNAIYAPDFVWQFVPFPDRDDAYGNIATTYLVPSSPTMTPDIFVTASRGELSASLQIEHTPEGWRTKP